MAKEKDRKKLTAEADSSGVSSAKFWKTALFFAGSAAFGGLAVALWNRKTLSEMHRRPSESVRPLPGEEDIY